MIIILSKKMKFAQNIYKNEFEIFCSRLDLVKRKLNLYISNIRQVK